MAVKILKRPEPSEKTFYCKCGCEFTADKEDYTIDFDDAPAYAKCPCCGLFVPEYTGGTETNTEKLKRDSIVNEVLENTDFVKLEGQMRLLGWTWATTNGRTPNAIELKREAKMMLEESYDTECSITTGGFKTMYRKYDDGEILLGLMFCIADTTYITIDKNGKIDYI